MELNLNKVPIDKTSGDRTGFADICKTAAKDNSSPQIDIPICPAKMQDDENDGGKTGGGSFTGVATRTKTRTKKPNLYRVLLLNDDFTPMEFVVMILERFFGMNHAQAFELMLTVHKKGLAVVGVFAYEIAETKVTQVMELARQYQHPLQCTMEKE